MAVNVQCPKCRLTFGVPAEQTGRPAACPQCGERIVAGGATGSAVAGNVAVGGAMTNGMAGVGATAVGAAASGAAISGSRSASERAGAESVPPLPPRSHLYPPGMAPPGDAPPVSPISAGGAKPPSADAAPPRMPVEPRRAASLLSPAPSATTAAPPTPPKAPSVPPPGSAVPPGMASPAAPAATTGNVAPPPVGPPAVGPRTPPTGPAPGAAVGPPTPPPQTAAPRMAPHAVPPAAPSTVPPATSPTAPPTAVPTAFPPAHSATGRAALSAPTPPVPPAPPGTTTPPVPPGMPSAPAAAVGSAPPQIPPAIPSAAAPPPAAARTNPGARPTQSARFIAADAAAVRVPLGADGKLPALVLVDLASPKDEEAEGKKKTTPPWLLLVVFGFSVSASVALLFVDSSSPVVERQSKAKAREFLQKYYAGSKTPLAPYQQNVRLALQAYQRGDRDAERRFYREVLDILHAESKNRFTGITGMVDSPDPPVGNPSDRHLESLIAVLLAE